MSEAVIRFHIADGVIVAVTETIDGTHGPVLANPRDIEDAVARVASTPVGGKENGNEEK